jgi:hypothetical protein
VSRLSGGGAIVARGKTFGLFARSGGKAVYVGTFSTRENAEAAKTQVKTAILAGKPIPTFPRRHAHATCRNCWQKGHNRMACENPTAPRPARPRMSREERSAILSAAALKRAPRKKRTMPPAVVKGPPACYRCFRVGHLTEVCPRAPAIATKAA